MLLAHQVAGSGPVVVLLHSGVTDSGMWDRQWAPFIEAGFRAVRPDLSGFGRSPARTETYSDAEDVVTLLDQLEVGTAILVGSSFGGLVAQEIAARWPDRVSALVLLCTASPLLAPDDAIRDFGGREDAFLEADDVAGATELNVQAWLGPDADDATRERVRAMQRHAFEPQLAVDAEVEQVPREFDPAAITAPTLVVSGAHDFEPFRTVARQLATLIPHARHVELPWAGHLPSLERPDETTRLLLEFARSPSVHAG